MVERSSLESSAGPWDSLIGKALAEVFSRLPIEERLKTIPLVCRAWRDAVQEPSCWRTVDMTDYIERKVDEDFLWEESENCEVEMESLIKAVVDRSSGVMVELRTAYCSDAAAAHIAKNCPVLSVLAVAKSASITDASATALALKCPKLTSLDLSDCYNVSSKSLEAFGRNCPSLTSLARNMRHIGNHNFVPARATCSLPGGNDEALVIATHMAELRHLEMINGSLTDKGLMRIAKECRQLEGLNLANCKKVSPVALEKVGTTCTKLKTFVKPIIPRMYIPPQHLAETWD